MFLSQRDWGWKSQFGHSNACIFSKENPLMCLFNLQSKKIIMFFPQKMMYYDVKSYAWVHSSSYRYSRGASPLSTVNLWVIIIIICGYFRYYITPWMVNTALEGNSLIFPWLWILISLLTRPQLPFTKMPTKKKVNKWFILVF